MFYYNHNQEMDNNFFQRLWKRLSGRRSALPKRDQHLRSYQLEQDLAQVVHGLADNEQRLPQEMAADLFFSGLAQQESNQALIRRWENLSRREQEVTARICQGCDRRQIAEALFISVETLRTHARHALVKFGVNDREELRRLLRGWDFSAWK